MLSESPFSASEYQERGFTGPVQLFSPERAAAVLDAFQRAEHEAKRNPAGGQRTETRTKNGTVVKAGPGSPPSTHPLTWDATAPFASDPGLLDCCAEILGNDIVLWATVFWNKPPQTTVYIPCKFFASNPPLLVIYDCVLADCF